jgi:hypothetical protein
MSTVRRNLTPTQQRSVVLGAMGLFTLIGVGLALAGVSTIRNSTSGDYQQTTAPGEPGYQAAVVPTPTLVVLQPDADGTLVGATVLALEPEDAGGSVVLVPPSTIVAEATAAPGTTGAGGPADSGSTTSGGSGSTAARGAGGEVTIAEVYRRDGPGAAAAAVGRALNVGIDGHTEVDADRWARLVEPFGSVEVTLDEAVGDLPAGTDELAPEDVGPFLAARSDDETDLDRLDRQQAFWNVWLAQVADGGADALPGEVGTGIGRFVLGVSQVDGPAAALPVQRDDEGGNGVRFRPDPTQVGEFVARTVPYPTSSEPGARTRIRLLNGTGDPDLTARAARVLVGAGAEVVIAGNGQTFDEPTTAFAYTGADRLPLATWLAAAFGGAEVEEVVADGESPVASDEEIDVTVILGNDADDLMER